MGSRQQGRNTTGFTLIELLIIHEVNFLTPATIWFNVDASWSNGDENFYFRTAPKTSCGREFVGSTIHSGAGNYSYLDGHVKWLTPEESGEIECANGPLPVPFKD
jgi:prepilin-type processing-associated H-X9-DG protein